MHENCIQLFNQYAITHFSKDKSVLEIGPEFVPSTYCSLVGKAAKSWDYVDLKDRPGITYRATGEYSFPIDDNKYDIVISANVLEHVRKIWTWTRELTRVCRPGGLVITVNPASWPFHESPYDCWRVYPDGMRALYEDSGLEVLTSVFESLEDPGRKRYIPGRSKADRLEDIGWKGRLIDPFLRLLGVPTERSYDTITIGKKTD